MAQNPEELPNESRRFDREVCSNPECGRILWFQAIDIKIGYAYLGCSLCNTYTQVGTGLTVDYGHQLPIGAIALGMR